MLESHKLMTTEHSGHGDHGLPDGALVLIAHITANHGRREALENALCALIAPTRAEPGCRLYDLHTEAGTDGTFVFIEVWQDEAAWHSHMASPHIARFLARRDQDGLVAAFRLQTLRRIG